MKIKREFEIFKTAVELGRLIYSLIEILKFEDLSDANKPIIEENKIYCVELTKLILENSKGQDALKTLKLTEIKKKEITDRFGKNRLEIEKIVQEWENVKQIYDNISKIATECDIDFQTENFKDKKYIIIKHENFAYIKNILQKNISSIESGLSGVDNHKYSTRTVEKMQGFKVNLMDLFEIVEKLEYNQLNLERHMMNYAVLQSNTDLFVKLKQAEQHYKSLIEHVSKHSKVLEILKVKDTFKESLVTISKNLTEIPTSYQEDH